MSDRPFARGESAVPTVPVREDSVKRTARETHGRSLGSTPLPIWSAHKTGYTAERRIANNHTSNPNRAHRVDHVYDAVRLKHVLDRDFGSVAFSVPYQDMSFSI